jgi:hypothetical protein
LALSTLPTLPTLPTFVGGNLATRVTGEALRAVRTIGV